MYILYHFPYSQHARRVVSLLEAAALPVPSCAMLTWRRARICQQTISRSIPTTRCRRWWTAISVLHESNAILRYLCHKHGLTEWYPADPKHRARVEQWLDWNQSRLSPGRHRHRGSTACSPARAGTS